MIAKEYVSISITDSGCGIRASDIDKIFDPFFTTKSVGKGTGLGLSVVYGIVQSHRGFVEVESEVNEGTTFYLYFPPARRKLSIETEDTGQEIPEGSETILIVDDEQMIRDSVKDILQSLGYGERPSPSRSMCHTGTLPARRSLRPRVIRGKDAREAKTMEGFARRPVGQVLVPRQLLGGPDHRRTPRPLR